MKCLFSDCYLAYADPFYFYTFHDALSYCEDIGGEFAVPTNPQELGLLGYILGEKIPEKFNGQKKTICFLSIFFKL